MAESVFHRTGTEGKGLKWLAAAACACAAGSLAVYAQTAGFGFAGYDDTLFVRDGWLVRDGLTWPHAVAAFTEFAYWSVWMPLTYLCHMAQVSLFGMDPGAMHLAGAVFHALDSALAAVLLFSLCGPREPAAPASRNRALLAAFAGAAFWAWHPLRAESAAWIAAQKDCLFAFFGLLALLRWTRLVRAAGEGAEARPDAACWGLALASALCKPSAMAVPFLFPAAEFALRRRTALRKFLPLFALAALCGAGAVYSHALSGEHRETAPAAANALNAVNSFGWYAVKTAWPSRLYIPYLRGKGPVPPELPWAGAAALALVAAGAAAAARGKWAFSREKGWEIAFGGGPGAAGVLAGLAWYAAAVAPSLGIVGFAYQSRADRFSYLAALGFSLAFAAAAARMRPKLSAAVSCALLAAACACGVAAWRQAGWWRDCRTLFTRGWELSGGSNHIAASILAEDCFGRDHDLKGTVLWSERYYALYPGLKNRPLYIVALMEAGEREKARRALDDFSRDFDKEIGEAPELPGPDAAREGAPGPRQATPAERKRAAKEGDMRLCYAMRNLLDGDAEAAWEMASAEARAHPDEPLHLYVAGRAAEASGRAEAAEAFYRKTGYVFLKQKEGVKKR